ncbi:MAG TPA: hypothetical protein VIT22_06040 [Pseudoxanthomonas sp.]
MLGATNLFFGAFIQKCKAAVCNAITVLLELGGLPVLAAMLLLTLALLLRFIRRLRVPGRDIAIAAVAWVALVCSFLQFSAY